jgi:hypothetical protein
MPGIRAVRNEVLLPDPTDSRVFDAILLIFGKKTLLGRYHEGLWINAKSETVLAASQPKD